MAFGESSGGFGGKKKKAPTYRDRPPADRTRKSWLPVPEDPDAEPLPLTEDQHAKLLARATNLCVWHLSQSGKTRKQLSESMRKHEVPDDIQDAVLDRLTELRLVDDEAFAVSFAASRHEYRRMGSGAIRQSLRQKGIDDEAITVAMEGIDPEAEAANARTLVDRKLRSTQGLDRNKRTQRLVGMLTRKGYNMGLSFQVIKEALEAEAEQVEAEQAEADRAEQAERA